MKKLISGMMMALLALGTLALVFNVQLVRAIGTIHIRADGSIDPPTAPINTADNVTYTLTGNITADTDGIVIERDNIVLSGAGYTITGSNPGILAPQVIGIVLTNRSNVTVRNTTIKGFSGDLFLNYSDNNVLSGNNANIGLDSSDNNVLSDNSGSISLGTSDNNVLIGNTGLVTLFQFSDNNVLSGNNANDGIVLTYSSDNNVLSGNNVKANGWYGIVLWSSSNNNTISGNNVTANKNGGIWLNSSSSNTISGNNVTANTMCGIELQFSSNNNVSGNNVTANSWYGIYLALDSDNNSVSGNNIAANNYTGAILIYASNNFICHNNFVNNTNQAYTEGSANVWDDGYPSGGNYWSDYNGTGTHQNETGSDGIGDTPYTIDTNNADHYPLMKPWHPLLGDLNFDGKVSLTDLVTLANAYGSKPGDKNWNPNADIDGNGVVGLSDLVILAQHYGQHYP